jgi:hypothetical protein
MKIALYLDIHGPSYEQPKILPFRPLNLIPSVAICSSQFKLLSGVPRDGAMK